MVRQDSEMFKVHPESQCIWRIGDTTPEPYHTGDFPSKKHPDTDPGIGMTIPQYPVAPTNYGLDRKLNMIIELLTDIKMRLG